MISVSTDEVPGTLEKGSIDKEAINLDDINALGEEYPHGVILYSCLIALSLSLFLAALDIMIVSSIIEDIAVRFNGYTKIGWLFTGYSLPNALLSLMWGRISVPLGFKTSMLFAIIIFEIGSLVSALADSMDMIIGGRVLAGVGGSGIQGLCFVIGSSLVDEKGRGLVVAFMSSSFAVASVVGPFLGGAFTSHISWRWCFYINLPIGGLAFCLFIIFYNPHTENQSKMAIVKNQFKSAVEATKSFKKLNHLSSWKTIAHESIFTYDIVEFILCTAGLVLILLALTFGGNQYAWRSAAVIVMFVIGILLTICALVYDFIIFPNFKTVKANIKYQPLMSWRIIKKPGIFTVNLANFFMCAAYICQMTYIIQFFQLIYNDSAWKASEHLIACAVPTVITVFLCGMVNLKFGLVKPVIVFGGITGFVGAGLLCLLNNKSNNAQHIGLLILSGVGFGATIQSSMMASQINLDKTVPTYGQDFVAVVTLNAFLKNLGQAFGGVLCDTVFSASAINRVKKAKLKLPGGNTINNLIITRETQFDGATSQLGNIVSKAIVDVFYMALGFAALAFLFSLFASNKKIDIKKPTKDIESHGADDSTSKSATTDDDSLSDIEVEKK